MISIGSRHPYYILAPRYARTSAGVRVLFRLADLINKAGGSAFVFLWPRFNSDLAASPMDVAPFLTAKSRDYHFKNGLTPIIIYPEIFRIARFAPPIRVRYLLNYDELLCENEPLENDDYLLAYSEAIAEQIPVSKPHGIVFLPVSDPVFFRPPIEPVSRIGGVYYAGKFKYRFNGKTSRITDGMPEITRDRPDSQSPEEIRELFRKSEYFYCYEDSALALEAILCGCPTIFLPNEYFEKPLGAKELAGLGYAVGTSPVQLEHAKATVTEAREQYLRKMEDARVQVAAFIAETQKLAVGRPYTTPFAQKYLRPPGFLQQSLDLMRFVKDVIEDKGWRETLITILKRFKSGRLRI